MTKVNAERFVGDFFHRRTLTPDCETCKQPWTPLKSRASLKLRIEPHARALASFRCPHHEKLCAAKHIADLCADWLEHFDSPQQIEAEMLRRVTADAYRSSRVFDAFVLEAAEFILTISDSEDQYAQVVKLLAGALHARLNGSGWLR